MLQNNERIVKHKLGLLNLAEELSNVSKACKTIFFCAMPVMTTKLP